MPKTSLRENFISAGFDRMWRLGYSAATVRDLAAEANAPQGSFTNHFRSKEQFACAVLDRYFAYLRMIALEALQDTTLAPLDRLKRYFEVIISRLEEAEFARGCLIGNLSVEASPQSELLREHLAGLLHEWSAAFEACIAEGQVRSEIPADSSAHDLADFLLNSWHGAMLRMKVERTAEPLRQFQQLAFSLFTRKETHNATAQSAPGA